MAIAPRPYQVDGIARFSARVAEGARRVCIVMATGGGKTAVASILIADFVSQGKRVLFLAHRRELIKQTLHKLVMNEIPIEQIGIIMAGVESRKLFSLAHAKTVDDVWALGARRNPIAPVQIASIDTLRSRELPPFDVLFIDECHRALAATYVKMREHYVRALQIGLTATPYRADGKGLGTAYDEIVQIASPRELVAAGYLAEPRVWTVPACDLPDLKRIKIKGGDYDATALTAAVDQSGLVGSITEHWGRHGREARTVVFASGVEHSRHIVERFSSCGVVAEHLDGETPTAERERILAALESGSTRVVSNVGVLTEGWDMPSVKCCVLARPTKSQGLYLQMAGRILRPYEDTQAVILDHSGAVLEHGLPTDDREFSLEDAPRQKREKDSDVGALTTCDRCFAIYPSEAGVCPTCGFVKPPPVRSLEEAPGELVEVRASTTDERRKVWDELVAKGKERGYKPGWAANQYKEKYGTWPPNSFPRPVDSEAGEPEKRAYLARLRNEQSERGYKQGYVHARFNAKFGHGVPLGW